MRVLGNKGAIIISPFLLLVVTVSGIGCQTISLRSGNRNSNAVIGITQKGERIFRENDFSLLLNGGIYNRGIGKYHDYQSLQIFSFFIKKIYIKRDFLVLSCIDKYICLKNLCVCISIWNSLLFRLGNISIIGCI